LESPVETVLQLMDVVRRKAFDEGSALVHEDVEFDWSNSRAPYSGVTRGRAEMERFWRTWLEAWEEWAPEIDEAIEIEPETVLIVTNVRARGTGSGVPVRAQGASIWTVREGKVVYAKLFQSKEEALAAVESQRTGGP
jgi:ketosteroid isomerase-like protein